MKPNPIPTFAAALTSTVFLITLAAPVSADPVQWPVNGHFYNVVSVPATISWDEANVAATAAGGYLATITTSTESAFVFSLINNSMYWSGSSGPWLGGYQYPPTQQPNANWRWVTGESWSCTNWQTGQPNDSGGTVEDSCSLASERWSPPGTTASPSTPHGQSLMASNGTATLPGHAPALPTNGMAAS
jgi:hypothetical protein